MIATDIGFREARMPRVQAYVERVCLPDVAEEATAAAFVDFLARAGDPAAADGELELLLLQGTRSAAASRFAVAVPVGHPQLALSAECRAMPELLATHANHESLTDEQLIADHLADCVICAHTLTRMQDAEQAFAAAAAELPALDVPQTSVDVRKARPRPAPASVPARVRTPAPRPPADPRPSPQPETRPAAATRSRRRSGGLVGAIRRLSRPGTG